LLSEIYDVLERDGLERREVDCAEQVPAALSSESGNAVLVYSERGQPMATNLLRLLRKNWSEVPVIVLVDRTNFDEFYELMSEGAYDYFETPEGAMVIAEALRWAAYTHALPPCMPRGSVLRKDAPVAVDALLIA
jgi:DNA-binding NtrC family response regulator